MRGKVLKHLLFNHYHLLKTSFQPLLLYFMLLLYRIENWALSFGKLLHETAWKATGYDTLEKVNSMS